MRLRWSQGPVLSRVRRHRHGAAIDQEVGVEQLGKQPRELWNELTATIPLGRPAQPVDIARVVCSLASPGADYMTGQAINVTGGLIMH